MAEAMESELDPDRIGRIGERQFETLCERAGLSCNKSVVDVMGWDFIVEFPMPPAGQELPLDQRPTNAARVQLKSTLGRVGNRIRLSLSAIDRLAKDPRPALIVVFRLRTDGEIQSAYLVHLIGNELARILRRLRLAEARKAHGINHTDISNDYEKVGVRFEPSPTGLLAALSAACGQNPGAYTIEKQRQLAELGYENGQFEAEALIQIEGPEHFSNLLLGLEPLRPHRLRVFDSRFGIRLPYQGALFDDIEELRLTPPTLGSCEISIRGPGFAQAALFAGEMFIGPSMAKPYGPELLVRTPDFIIRLTPAGLLWCGIGPARADLTVSEFRKSKATSEETSYLEGLMDGIEITNALAQTGHPVFCTQGFFTSVEEFREFLDSYIQANASAGKEHIASVATSALMAAYPCSGR